MGDLLRVCASIIVLSIPLALSMWALLDAAHRPAWAWALTDRRQAVWMAAILLGLFSVIGGLIVATIYLTKIRPIVASAELSPGSSG